MNRNKVQLRRLLALDESIRGLRYPNCFSFARGEGVSRKTIQRDLEFMRDHWGAPLFFDPIRNGYRYSDKTWFLPAIKMTEGDLVHLMVGACALQQYHGTPVAAELDRVFAKMATMLPAEITIRPETVSSAFSFVGPPAKSVSAEVWTMLVRGLLNRLSVDIRYRSFESSGPTDRRIDPYHMANLQGEWYVFARCHTKGEVRQFAIPRVDKATLTQEVFEFPTDWDVRQTLGGVFSRFASRAPAKPVRLLFDRDVASRICDCEWHATQTLKHRRDGGVELTFHAAGLLEIQRWILGWGRHVRVLGPSELKKMVEGEIRAMATQV